MFTYMLLMTEIWSIIVRWLPALSNSSLIRYANEFVSMLASDGFHDVIMQINWCCKWGFTWRGGAVIMQIRGHGRVV